MKYKYNLNLQFNKTILYKRRKRTNILCKMDFGSKNKKLCAKLFLYFVKCQMAIRGALRA